MPNSFITKKTHKVRMIDVCVMTKAVLYDVKTTSKQWIQPPTILPLHPDVTECARSICSEIQTQVTSTSHCQKPHKHALKFQYNSNAD